LQVLAYNKTGGNESMDSTTAVYLAALYWAVMTMTTIGCVPADAGGLPLVRWVARGVRRPEACWAAVTTVPACRAP
jgi:hypothetical protein